jgi:hypothetical protein
MSGILWPQNLFSRKPTIRATSLTIGTWIKGKNGKIYKVVDVVNCTSETLITTFHELDGQQSFSVLPSLIVEIGNAPEEEGAPREEEESAVTPVTEGDESLVVITFRRTSAPDRRMPLSPGESPRRVVSEYARMAPDFSRMRKSESSKRLSGNSLANTADDSKLEDNVKDTEENDGKRKSDK